MTALQLYKNLIDGLVQRRKSVSIRNILQGSFPEESGHAYANEILGQLSLEQREIVAKLVQDGKDEGTHDTLAYFNEQIDLDGLRFIQHGIELPIAPFGTELFWDWGERCDGKTWPDER
ncbi:MAG: hypothetical protein HY862_02995 [Chloroflexi bacterium]|nr:hypothetical protein [Chloroflexota bacterium]